VTQDEELKEYLRKNALRPEAKKPEPKLDAKPGTMTPKKLFFRGLRGYLPVLFLFLPLIGIIAFTGFSKLYSESIAGLYTLTLLAVIVLSSAGWWGYRFIQYTNWTNGRIYPFHGWQEFLAQRSRNYWKGEYYISVSIAVRFSKDASPLHREAVGLFFTNVVRKRGKKYEEMEWHAGGRPTDFTAHGPALTGDISQRQMEWFIKIFVHQFQTVAKLLGNTLASVTIEAKGNEREFIHKKQRRDAYERQSSFGN
jgi:hypothetical protein